ncbi:hypothetical protein P7K49_039052 [Saguinus oedipus]|uniref:Uncharacterized protein n=1 Tax=Saguinus oedipus TaxID=9490 RepID=A0ABQ9TGE5_SAGOE|nr:hypothetical protein P7K49_039052 [Saguinus oedipus]
MGKIPILNSDSKAKQSKGRDPLVSGLFRLSQARELAAGPDPKGLPGVGALPRPLPGPDPGSGARRALHCPPQGGRRAPSWTQRFHFLGPAGTALRRCLSVPVPRQEMSSSWEDGR